MGRDEVVAHVKLVVMTRRASVIFLLWSLTGTLFPPLAAKTPTPEEVGQSFLDVSPLHPAYPAVEYLKSTGVLQGYADGTFRPDAKVNRAEATKIIVAPRVTAE